MKFSMFPNQISRRINTAEYVHILVDLHMCARVSMRNILPRIFNYLKGFYLSIQADNKLNVASVKKGSREHNISAPLTAEKVN